ncbi:MAG: Rpn family recombination-promoting nuclease/putative transposase [Spirochaetia bacterium]|jgi:predicted transposase YdaD|nr:Rpn family recombination-promoting nuclease/putative transposase [Spirochaetia bacterium]
MKDIISPHDKLFKEIESVKENTKDLIESTFSEELLKHLNLETLENDNNSYIDSSLKEYYSDLVFHAFTTIH